MPLLWKMLHPKIKLEIFLVGSKAYKLEVKASHMLLRGLHSSETQRPFVELRVKASTFVMSEHLMRLKTHAGFLKNPGVDSGLFFFGRTWSLREKGFGGLRARLLWLLRRDGILEKACASAFVTCGDPSDVHVSVPRFTVCKAFGLHYQTRDG